MTPARERMFVVLALVALGGFAVLVSTRTFAVVTVPGLARPVEVAGSQAAPALAPLGLACLALAGALTIAGPVVRRVLGAVLVLLGAAEVLLLVPLAADPASGVLGAVSTATGLVGAADGAVAGSGWAAAGTVGGVLAAAVGVVVLIRAGRWSTGGRRFRKQDAAVVRSTDPIAEWDALTRGGDPTE
ncbi:Trp biosynthesis-associated membrane protein [Amnibacterium endophyticum]|uniref:Trp biosynthesis-associated membrane protein n=1 Tax=Amnibacterium endophyticum TaxID=2109337 RepID=A0ABW4LCF0_9MICO